MQDDWVQVNNQLSGKSYFWKVGTGETLWKLPDDQSEKDIQVKSVDGKAPSKRKDEAKVWEKVKDPAGNMYFWNTRTDETTWAPPPVVPDAELEKKRAAASVQKAGAEAGVKVISGIDGLMKFDQGGSPRTVSPQTSPRTRLGFLGSGKDTQKEEKGHSGKGSSKRGSKESSTIQNIKNKMRESKGKASAEDVVREMEIGAPFGVQHNVHVRFDKSNIRFSGMPSEWDLGTQDQFGVSLQGCPRVEMDGYRERIPAVLAMLKHDLIRKEGFSSEGIFRITAEKVEVERVKLRINAGDGLSALKDCPDPNVPANLIKLWFRELRPNLLNCLEKDQLLMYAALSKDLAQLGPKIDDLQEPQQSVLLWLLDLLCDITEHVEINRMTPKNLAIVMSPNLFDIGDASPMEGLAIAPKLAAFLENLILWRKEEREKRQTSLVSQDDGNSPTEEKETALVTDTATLSAPPPDADEI